jgi:S-ribosylhomocysteine lyase
MGCRTGFYLLLEGELSSQEVLPLVRELLEWVIAFTGPIPGAHPAECGNYLEQNLGMAQWEAARYLRVLEKPVLEYPG